jgi:hypothetical protein
MEAKGGTCCDPAYLKTRFLKSMFLGGGSVTALAILKKAKSISGLNTKVVSPIELVMELDI